MAKTDRVKKARPSPGHSEIRNERQPTGRGEPTRSASRVRRICLFTTPFPFMHPINNGIAACSKRVGPWHVEIHFFVRSEDVVQFVRERGYDGVIVTYGADFVPKLEAEGVAVVTAMAAFSGSPAVLCDDRAIGMMGARHLIECGYRRFAFYGNSTAWSDQRLEGFRRTLRAEGFAATSNSDGPRADGSESRPFADNNAAVNRFLDELRPPLAVMACHDALGRMLVDQAMARRWRVPGDIAIMGVDNDELLCETGSCPLTSVDPNLHRIGFETALLLDRRLRGDRHLSSEVCIPPREVARRQSTSLFSHDDPDIAAALRLIHSRACEGLRVDEICHHVAMSRRQFEQRFRKAIGRSPGDEIRVQRMDRAKALLMETRMGLSEIATRCGYQFVSGLSAAFRRVVGMSPTEFRARNAE
jgi:LacI family transcriptional regulator